MSACSAILTVSQIGDPKTEKNANISSIERDMNDFDNANAWELFFERLQNISSIQTRDLTVDSGQSIENRLKNRYRDVTPYDSTRILLKCAYTGDYINANFVQIDAVKQRRYILAQGPLQQTCEHFWQMVWEQKSPAIIMLNRVYERGSLKCHKYFPECEKTVHCEAIGLDISCTSEDEHGFYIMKRLSILETATEKRHHLLHFHYINWPDFGVPSSPGSMLNFLWHIRHEGVLSHPETPAIIHCSAGIGRSGTFVLIDLALFLIEQFNSMNDISLTDMLLSLRQCRMGIVQTAHQLRYSYKAIIEGGRLLLATPPSERASLRFPEDDPLIPHPDASDDDGDDADDDDDDDLDGDGYFVNDEGQMRMRATAGDPNQQMKFFFEGYYSDNPSDEEDGQEDEVMHLLATATRNQWQQHVEVNSANVGVVIEEVFDEPQVTVTEPGASCQPVMNSTEIASNLPADVPSPPTFTVATEEITDSPPLNEVTNGESSSETADGNDNDSTEEDEGEAAIIIAAFLAARDRRDARAARKQVTLAKLAEITARMRDRELLRHRRLPPSIAVPLTRWFTASGYINTPAQAVFVCLGVFTLLIALVLGYYYK